MEVAAERPMKEVSIVQRKADALLGSVESEEYELVEITVDSGAADSAIPPGLLKQFPTNHVKY